jgi:protein tyrosine phosphatase
MFIILSCLLALSQTLGAVTIGNEPSRFPEETIAISELKARSEYMKACYHEKAWELAFKINRQFKKHIKKTNHDFSKNASKHRLLYVPREELNASDVYVSNFGKYVLFGCPRSATEAGFLFDACMQYDVTLFVSLLESHEAKEKYNNYWQEHKLSQIQTPGGWTFSKIKSKVLYEAELEADGLHKPQLIKTTIIASNHQGLRRKLTHLHYEGWRDKEAMSSEQLFLSLIKYMGNRQKNKKDKPIAINCHGGVGRTGTLALSYYLKNEIDAYLDQGISPDEIFVNVPDLLFAFRLQRNYFLQQATQLSNLYSVLGDYVFERTGVKRPLSSVKMPICSAEELFSSEACQLKDLKKQIEAFRKSDQENFELLEDKISLKFNQFLERKRKEGKAHDFDATLVGKRMLNRPEDEFINASDLTLGDDRYILFACPHHMEGVAAVFDAALQKDVTLFVSTLKSTDASDRMNNFWDGTKPDQVKTRDGWTITHQSNRIYKQTDETSRIIESTLLAEKEGVIKTLTHLHFDGWEQDQEVTDNELYRHFLDRIEELHKGSDSPIAVHSKWGVGRSGVTILNLQLRRFVRKQQQLGVKLQDVEINIAKLIFEFRKQRGGFVEHGALVAQTYDSILAFYENQQNS